MSGTYFITITDTYYGVNVFTGSFIVDFNQSPNIIAFYENGNPNNILANISSYGNNDNIFVSRSYPFDNFGTNITTMSYYGGNYGYNNQPPPNGDGTYNLYSFPSNGFKGIAIPSIFNFDSTYLFNVIGGPVYPPFPLDGSIPPACFYTIQGLPSYLNQNAQYKIYYSDNPQFPYLTVYAPDLYYLAPSTSYDLATVPLSPFLTTMNQSQLVTYQEQLQLFKKVYTHNSNAYITYVSNPGTAQGPIYYTFQNYAELNNYKAGLQLANRLYPFDVMATAYNSVTSVPLRWIVPFPM
jgi:hypothetical protein